MRRFGWAAAVVLVACGGGGTPDGGGTGSQCTPACGLSTQCIEGECVPLENDPPRLMSWYPTKYEARISDPLLFQFDEPLRALSPGDVTVTSDAGILAAEVSLEADAGRITVLPRFDPPAVVQIGFPGVKDLATNVTEQAPIPYSFPVWFTVPKPEKTSSAETGATVDPGGAPVMVMMEQDVLSVRRFDGGVWGELGDLSAVTNPDPPARVAARDNELTILTGDYDPGTVTNVWTVRRFNGASWDALPNAYTGMALSGALALDSLLRPVIAAMTSGDVTVRRWTGTAWTTLPVLSSEADLRFQVPVLAVDGADRPIVVYPDEGASGELQLKVVRYDTDTWTPLGAPFTTPTVYAPSLVVQPSGELILVWQTPTTVEASRWNGSAWTTQTIASVEAPETIEDVTAGQVIGDGVYAAVTDSSDRLRLFRTDGGAWSLLRSASLDGTTFSPTSRLLLVGGVSGRELWLIGRGASWQVALYNR